MQRPRTPCKRWMCVTSGSAHESSQASVTIKFLKVQGKKRGENGSECSCVQTKYTCVQCVSHIVDACACSGARCGCSRWERGKIASISSYNTATTPTLLLNQHVQHQSASQGALPQVNHSNRDTAGATIPEYDSHFGPTNQQATVHGVLTKAWAMGNRLANE